MPKPAPTNYPPYFQRYIDQVPEEDLAAGFRNQWPVIEEFLSGISEERSTFAYAPGKWTLKEMLQHIIDAERVFGYRAMCFARKEKASLPSFEEDDYAAASNANARSWKSMSEEFRILRKSTEMLFESFSPDALRSIGIANNNPTSVESLGFINLGHFYHHYRISKERYLQA